MSNTTHKPAAMPWALLLMLLLVGIGVYLYGVDPQPAIDILGADLAAKIGLVADTVGP